MPDDPLITMIKEDWIRRTTDTEETSDNIVLLRAELFLESPFLDRIRNATRRETSVLKELEKHDSETTEEDGIITKRGSIYVPPNTQLREDILKEHHDPPDIGHPGQHQMIELVGRNYWWPTLRSDIKRYTKGCLTCQRNKARTAPLKSPLHSLPIPNGPWEEISIDIIGPLPPSNGKDAILVIVDRFSKMIRLTATKTDISSRGVAQIYRDEIWKLHGIPHKVLSDRGPQFASEFTKELFKGLGIERTMSTAYHPQTDGQTERINREVETYLRMYCNYDQDDWTEWLSLAEFQYNDKQHSGTQETPFFLNYGRHPWKGINSPTNNPNSSSFLDQLQTARTNATTALKQYQEKMKQQHDKHRLHTKQYATGDLVWLENSNVHTNQPSKKLGQKRYGPFQIKEKIGEAAYRIKLPDGWAIHDVFNEQLLSPAHTPEFPSQNTPAPPDPTIINNEEEYEVDEIRGVRKRGRGYQFLIHWKGYSNEDDTWTAESNLGNATDAITEYLNKHPENAYKKRGKRT